ncbi:glycosyltransferase family 2 protein [Francisella tularensis subsp. novicida FSC159]|uniref:glycosyltransferase family 2 protein n=1 Tax=Francisella tularensis TaxID=263 RepID=UPI001C0EE6B0|nr:glycosyltransferase family 2 protein [Francisella tularensis]MBK2111619.1 glycosyltransferase family 2 protein [Francisella tularensis subsp. novicida FSC159]
MYKKYQVSVIIPAFNVENYIAEAVYSVLNQNYDSFEVIIIDDGSDDETYNIICEISKVHSNVKILKQKNKGQGAARNAGIQLSEAQYIVFVDADDILAEGALKLLTSKIADQDVVCAGLDFFKECKSRSAVTRSFNKEFSILNPDLFEDALSLKKFTSSPCAKIYNREFLITNGIYFPDNKFVGEDMLFSWKVAYYARSCLFISGICYHARYRLESTTRAMLIEKNFNSMLYIYQMLAEFLREVDEFDKYEKLYMASRVKAFMFLISRAAIHIKRRKEIYNFFKTNGYLLNFRINELQPKYLFVYFLYKVRCLFILKLIKKRLF